MFRIIRKSELDNMNKQIHQYQDDLQQADDDAKYQADTIRDMDTLIFQMTQCLDWPSMRPYFQKLMEGMEIRRKAEPDRIANIMRTELLSVYKGK